MPISVPMTNSVAGDFAHQAYIPAVDSTASAIATTTGRHSGWTTTGAPGCAARAASMSRGRSRPCVGQ